VAGSQAIKPQVHRNKERVPLSRATLSRNRYYRANEPRSPIPPDFSRSRMSEFGALSLLSSNDHPSADRSPPSVIPENIYAILIPRIRA
jgi:hypothetical protein